MIVNYSIVDEMEADAMTNRIDWRRTIADVCALLGVVMVLWIGWGMYVDHMRVTALWQWVNEANPRVFPERMQQVQQNATPSATPTVKK